MIGTTMSKLSTANAETQTDEVSKLFYDLTIARKELQNIRKELRRLNYCYRKDIENILTLLKTYKCESCYVNDDQVGTTNEIKAESTQPSFQPIGLITSEFPEKKGIPRQSGICGSQGKITLFNSVFTNPNHALQGLEDFSHMWILFHFHKNDSIHVRAKVAPPRLNGIKTGVLGTRSPHRPSPIGLSLVRIDRIENSCIYFTGVDMLDDTPVLDIKPYIPQYDNPSSSIKEWNSNSQSLDINYNNNKEIIDHSFIPREAPDGEECTSSDNLQTSAIHSLEEVRVPQWVVDQTVNQLAVSFNEKTRLYLNTLEEENSNSKDIETTIVDILREDPRSVYVRKQYSNQFYTFLIGEYHVSCKFDDVKHAVQVYKIVEANSLTE